MFLARVNAFLTDLRNFALFSRASVTLYDEGPGSSLFFTRSPRLSGEELLGWTCLLILS